MSMHGYAGKSKFKDIIEMLHRAEVNGSNTYYVYAYLAKEKGYDDLCEAIMANAAEDSFHGGRYGAMLGKGQPSDEDFWKAMVRFYELEAGAKPQLQAFADKARAGGEPQLAEEIEKSIAEEDEHAARLARVFDAHGIDYPKAAGG